MILESIPVRKYDLVIFGSGPAGTTLAFEYNRRNPERTVLVVEAGAFVFDENAQKSYQGETRIHFGDNLVKEDSNYLSSSRIKAFGGTSYHWSGWLRPLEKELFTADKWGFTYDELVPHYKKALEILGCPQELSYFDESSFFGSRLFESARYWVSPRPLRFGDAYRASFRRSSSVDLLLSSRLTQLRVNTRNEIENAEVESGLSRGEVKGNRFVLAMGGIENAAFLLRTQGGLPTVSDDWPGVLGRSFMEHLHLDVGDVYLDAAEDWQSYDTYGGATQPSVVLFQNKGRSRFSESLQFDVDPIESRSAEIFEDESEAVALMKDYFAKARGKKLVRKRLRMILEHSPDMESRVTVRSSSGKTRLEMLISNQQLADIRKSVALFGQSLLVSDVGFIRARDLEIRAENWSSYHAFYGYHHIGTTRIGATKKDGVVDSNLRVHGCSNLFIAGSSVFRTGGFAPPTLTVVALSCRLAQFLSETVK